MEGSCHESKKMKILCLHDFRTSGSFFQKQISRWDPSIFFNFDLVFPDGLFPASERSDIESIFPPPYFKWFQFNEGAALSALLNPNWVSISGDYPQGASTNEAVCVNLWEQF